MTMKSFARLVFFLFLSVFTIIGSASAADILPKVPNSFMYGLQAVWTDGTTTAIFHPMSGKIPTSSIGKIRISFQLSELSGPCRIRPAIQFSNDGVQWDNAAPIDTTGSDYITTNSIDYGTAWIDITTIAGTTPRAYAMIGVQAANASAGNTGFCNARVRIEEAI